MTDDTLHIQEHDMPAVEALIAASMALMTAYSQALQAERHPQHRVAMGSRIVAHLNLLRRQPALSPGFGEVLQTLLRCWQTMQACTQEAACCQAAAPGDGGRPDGDSPDGDGVGVSAWHAAGSPADGDDVDRHRIGARGPSGRPGDPKRLH